MTTLEDDLRETFRSRDRIVPAPGLAEDILRRVHRRQTRRRRAVAGVAVAALLGGAAGLVGGWFGGASPVSLLPAEGIKCDGFSVRALGAGTSGRETRNVAISLTNTSEGGCSISPDLKVAVLVGERRLDVTQLPLVRDRGPVDVGSGATLSLELVWDNWCLGQVRAARMHLSLPGGFGLTTEPFQLSPTCREKEAPSTVRLFQLGLADVATPSSAAPVPDQGGDRLRAALAYRAALEK